MLVAYGTLLSLLCNDCVQSTRNQSHIKFCTASKMLQTVSIEDKSGEFEDQSFGGI